ncbi:hypothetical protein Acel_2145 [Acidothermus cellulolyticus 11B]|uniref:Protein kinase domain-containing protein n=1 Tax=Acidothermus cellulolyticus (strain ATCC 43068 / DSM 8971 / 11B) TaxID=351607 RepID=A0LWV7_ACIC1|nr:hypothetical protein [Acidothermus cellulolyticus]ABK53917.1 hypothetical protein Acel_2145 [Acidothermus cellulolyticus 11B]
MSSVSTLTAGTVLAGRYRLERPLDVAPSHGATASHAVWSARDDLLARPVAVRIHRTGEYAGQASFGDVRGAARLVHPALLRIYDAGEGDDFGYLVTELPAGETLEDRLHAGPLDPAEAAALLLVLADGVARAHAAGFCRFSITPHTVRLLPTGQPRLDSVPVAETGDPTGIADDVRALGWLGYAAATAKWPGPPRLSSLPPAPRVEGALCTVRQVRGGVPRNFDDIISRLIGLSGPPITSADELATQLEQQQRIEDVEETREFAPVPAAQRTRWVPGRGQRWSLAAALVLLIAGLIGLFRNNSGGYLQFPHHTGPAQQTVPARSPSPAPVVIHPASIEEFDPYGDHTDPHVKEAPAAIDGDPETAWHTQTFFSPAFGNIKPGVGLLVDLGASRHVATIDVRMLNAGATVALYASDTAPHTERDMQHIATSADAGLTVSFRPDQAHRYWLLWLTRLPPARGGYASGISEITFRS